MKIVLCTCDEFDNCCADIVRGSNYNQKCAFLSTCTLNNIRFCVLFLEKE